MGKRMRRKMRAADEKKQPNEPKAPFVERKLDELKTMDDEIRRLLRGE